jgi:Lon protease-like protein
MAVTPMFPLGSVLLPGERLPLHVFEPRYLALVDECVHHREQPDFGVVLISHGHEVGGGDQRTDVGALARIISGYELPGGRRALECVGTERIRIGAWLPDDPYPQAQVELWPDESAELDPSVSVVVDGLVEQLRTLAAEAAERTGGQKPGNPLDQLPDDAGQRAYALAARLPLGQADRYALLAAPDPAQRMARLAAALEDLIAAVRFRLT